MYTSAVATPDDDTMRAWSALLVAHRRTTTALDAELRQGCDLSLDDYDVLYQLRRAGGAARMSDLAEQVLITRPTTTRVVDRLVERGWIVRHRDGSDRRVVRVELTDEGRQVQRRAARLHLDGIARLVERRLSRVQLDALADALEVLATPEAAGPP